MSKKKSVSFDGGPVGYKRPPAEHQFKPGQKPPGSGRKKRSKNYATLVTELMESRVRVMQHGKPRTMPLKKALLLRAAAGALNGGPIDVQRMFDLVTRLAPEHTRPEPLVIRYQLIDGDDW